MKKKNTTPREKGLDLEFYAEFEELPPRIKPGEYEVEFIRAEYVFLFNRPKIILWFRICQFGTEYHGLELYMVCVHYKKYSPSSKFYQTYYGGNRLQTPSG